ncbi:hypothetical protein [Campylobacter curvus]|uniref:hypothetical protein n=1 Tax=Campylobacter curvus TaxID=200 RepID=UPI0014701C82|nr:hypothetical protein [Campylobacter curvus]
MKALVAIAIFLLFCQNLSSNEAKKEVPKVCYEVAHDYFDMNVPDIDTPVDSGTFGSVGVMMLASGAFSEEMCEMMKKEMRDKFDAINLREIDKRFKDRLSPACQRTFDAINEYTMSAMTYKIKLEKQKKTKLLIVNGGAKMTDEMCERLEKKYQKALLEDKQSTTKRDENASVK